MRGPADPDFAITVGSNSRSYSFNYIHNNIRLLIMSMLHNM